MRQYYKPGHTHRPAEKVPQATPQPAAITPGDIKNEVARLALQLDSDEGNLFLVHSAGVWMEQAKTRPTPRMLFSEFWHEGELCILFSDTNLGKSILAVQIGNSISKGEAIPGFKLDAMPQPILYFDFELSEKQFEARYSVDYAEHYEFDESFYRAEMNPDADMPEGHGGFEDLLNHSIEKSILDTGARVLIIDNLTYLKTETEQARHALPLMKHLKALKQKYGLSILALAHTPKRDACMPITKNDLQGSKMLMNFCDSAFAIGQSHADKSMRYLKQIKQRYTESIYDAGNVIVCQTAKPGNFLRFDLLDYGKEWEHLKSPTNPEQAALETNIRELLEAEPGLSVFAIAKKLCPDESKLNSFRVKVNRIAQRINKL